MKRLLPFLLSLHLLAVSLLPGADTRVLLDLPAAWAHHDHDHADSSFLDFFFDHYLGDEHPHSKPGEHSSLPLHHAHSDVQAPVLFFELLAPIVLGSALPAHASAARRPQLVASGLATGNLRPCWQPPRA